MPHRKRLPNLLGAMPGGAQPQEISDAGRKVGDLPHIEGQSPNANRFNFPIGITTQSLQDRQVSVLPHRGANRVHFLERTHLNDAVARARHDRFYNRLGARHRRDAGYVVLQRRAPYCLFVKV